MLGRVFGIVVCVDHHHYKEVVAWQFDPATCSFVELMMKFSNPIALRDFLLLYLCNVATCDCTRPVYLLDILTRIWSNGLC